MNWFRNFMMGRYGTDQLTIALLILYMVIILIAEIFRIPILALIGLVLLVYAFFRTFSRNISRRYQENCQFLKLWNPIKGWFRTQKTRFRERKTHKYFKCPKCKATLRVPKGKGKICITCPKCGNEIIRKT